MSSFSSNPSNTPTNSISSSRRRLCPHGAYGPLCRCTSGDMISNSPLPPPSSTAQAATPQTAKSSTSSIRRLCPHGGYGPLCMCTSRDMTSSAPLPPLSSTAQAASIQDEPTTSLGDHIRAMLGIKAHKLCSHGSYGPLCVCNHKVVV
jgi:hypothetical protein